MPCTMQFYRGAHDEDEEEGVLFWCDQWWILFQIEQIIVDTTNIFREFSGIEFTLRRPIDTSQAELLLGDVAVIHRVMPSI